MVYLKKLTNKLTREEIKCKFRALNGKQPDNLETLS
jgi:hypothetical protein